MELELGETYTTLSGNKVTITNIDFSYTKPYFGNVITDKGNHVTVASYNTGGFYLNNGKQSEHDIILS